MTFTLPCELRPVARSNQKAVYNLLFTSSAAALQKLANDPRFVGGDIGMMGGLHTWQRDLGYHPHVHFIVPGGGLSPILWVRQESIFGRWHAKFWLRKTSIPYSLCSVPHNRKNWLFSGAPRGADASATFFNLIETAKVNGLEPYASFVTCLPNCRWPGRRKITVCFCRIVSIKILWPLCGDSISSL